MTMMTTRNSSSFHLWKNDGDDEHQLLFFLSNVDGDREQ